MQFPPTELGSPVFHTILLHHEDELPIQFEERFVNPRWVPDYLTADFSQPIASALDIDRATPACL